jgi:hypothetical protein
MKPTVEQFEEIIIDRFPPYDDNGVRFHGVYHGRFFYRGIGVDVSTTAQGMDIVDAVRAEGYTLGSWDHSDQLGLGSIIAWSAGNFADGAEVLGEGNALAANQ